MRAFVRSWRAAKQRGVVLPATEDPDYESLEHLLRHLLRAARGYVTWIHEVLGRPDPDIPLAPELETVVAEADAYLEKLLEAWRTRLVDLPGEIVDAPTAYLSRWNAPYTIDAMLEHAVVHPMRHRLQLDELVRAMG